MATSRGIELRLLIPSSPCCQHDASSAPNSASVHRPRQRNPRSSVSNPEYRSTAMYDRLEITIKEKPASARHNGHQRTRSDAVLSSSKSTPNLRKPLQEVPQPPLPAGRKPVKPYAYRHLNNSKSTVASGSSTSTDQSSAKLREFSPLTPENNQLFFRPSFHEASTGLAIDFEPVPVASPAAAPRRNHGTPVALYSPPQDVMIYELEDTSNPTHVISPQSPHYSNSLYEKPLPLLPCPKSLQKDKGKSENPIWPSKLRKRKNTGSGDRPLEKIQATSSVNSESRPGSSTGRRVTPKTTFYSNSPRPRTSHGSSSRPQEYSSHTPVLPTREPSRDHPPSSYHSPYPDVYQYQHSQPDIQLHHPPAAPHVSGKQKKKSHKPFSLHVGKLHLVFGSTKQELAESRKNPNMYRDFGHPNPLVCQDSLGRIRYR